MASEALISTNYFFNGQKSFYRGKVRDVYNIKDNYLVMIVTDRISAFDQVLPKPVPHKGQVLNQIASLFLDSVKHIVNSWKLEEPDPNVTVGVKCDPLPIEFIVRHYLSGHAWRLYKAGERTICGEKLPEGLKENDPLPKPILTPTTKAAEGHDKDITPEEIIKQGMMKKKEFNKVKDYALALFDYGYEWALKRDLILVDTKYEFGRYNDEFMLIDEIHTPDSSRYFYKETYEQIQDERGEQRQLSKEFVRKWLIDQGFQGNEGEILPDINADFVKAVSNRYIELYHKLTGRDLEPRLYANIDNEIEENINNWLKSVS